MKIIDRTPFFSADGKISLIDKARAVMKYGSTWVQETQVQAGIMAIFEKSLDNKYTLIRNLTLSGLDINIPFVLVGPTGIYVMVVTALRGMYRAKGDLWGTLSNSNFNPSNINLLTLTARMARAVQVYFQRLGHELPAVVDAILLCADPGMHVESIRPIVRVVQSDAIERFAISIGSGGSILDPLTVQSIIDRILIIKPSAPTPEDESAQQERLQSLPGGIQSAPTPEEEAPFPEYELPQSQPGFYNPEPQAVQEEEEAGTSETAPAESLIPPATENISSLAPMRENSFEASRPRSRKTRGITFKQWILLVVIAILEIALLATLYFLVMNTLR